MKKTVQVIKLHTNILFVSDDNVKVGDLVHCSWGVAEVTNMNPTGDLVEEGDFEIKVSDGYGIRSKENAKKIIATSYLRSPFPLIPQSFINSYYNAIKEVEIETEKRNYSHIYPGDGCVYIGSEYTAIKLNSQGEVIIVPKQERLYTKEEMQKAFIAGMDFVFATKLFEVNFEEFIKSI